MILYKFVIVASCALMVKNALKHISKESLIKVAALNLISVKYAKKHLKTPIVHYILFTKIYA